MKNSTLNNTINCSLAEISLHLTEIEYDNNEKFVFGKTLEYLENHLMRYFNMDEETVEIICWALGIESLSLADYLLKFLKRKQKTEFLAELQDCSNSSDDHPDILFRIIKKTPHKIKNKFKNHLFRLLKSKIGRLSWEGTSDVEKNIIQIKKMFNLSETEYQFLVFLFIIETFEKPESFFESHLKCRDFSGRKYLCNILNMNQIAINNILNGTLKKIEMIDFYRSSIDLNQDFLPWFQNPSKEMLTNKLYSSFSSDPVPLKDFFIEDDKKNHILRLLKNKPKSSTHLLFYGPPGSGKTSFANSLLKKLGSQSYIVRGSEDNTSVNRQTSITACINMTNTGAGSIIVVDEADNMLNTQMSWFMRGETQDKGWLNQFLDKPGLRFIWITNHINEIETSVLRRFAYSIQFKPFNRFQRIKLWNNILFKNNCENLVDQKDINLLSEKYKSSAGAIDIAVRKAVETKSKTTNSFLKSIKTTIEAHLTLMNKGDKPIDKEQTDRDYSLEGLNINSDIKKVITQLKKFDQHLKQSSIKDIRNINLLFYGPPGTGKSELARYIANELDRQIICKRISDIQSCYIGETEKNIRDVFEEAEREDAVLIIDEADSVLFNRDRAQRSWEISFTNEFLTQMESFHGILVCTTNQIKDLDSASMRRFSHKIGFKFLTTDGNIIFYKKMICPLIKDRLNKNEERFLASLNNLAPGDFKTVRNNFSFYPSKELNHELLISALKSELKHKKSYRDNQKIGF